MVSPSHVVRSTTPDACDSVYNPDPAGPGLKEVLGLQVDGVDGLETIDPNYCLSFLSTGTNSPFLGIIFPGDIITHINNQPIGDLANQIAPTVITWRLLEGDLVTLRYRKASEFYTNEYESTQSLAKFPEALEVLIAVNFKNEEKYKSLIKKKYSLDGNLVEKEKVKEYLSKNPNSQNIVHVQNNLDNNYNNNYTDENNNNEKPVPDSEDEIRKKIEKVLEKEKLADKPFIVNHIISKLASRSQLLSVEIKK